jgi:hypothetical protein
MVGVALTACPTEAVSCLQLYILGEGFSNKSVNFLWESRSALVLHLDVLNTNSRLPLGML